jgi:hypothetical protein
VNQVGLRPLLVAEGDDREISSHRGVEVPEGRVVRFGDVVKLFRDLVDARVGLLSVVAERDVRRSEKEHGNAGRGCAMVANDTSHPLLGRAPTR